MSHSSYRSPMRTPLVPVYTRLKDPRYRYTENSVQASREFMQNSSASSIPHPPIIPANPLPVILGFHVSLWRYVLRI